jgi:hypothetical protein
LFLLLLFVGCGEDTAVPTPSVKVSVEEALTAVHAKADAYRDCVITNNAQEDQNEQNRCLSQVDDTIPEFFIEVDEE